LRERARGVIHEVFDPQQNIGRTPRQQRGARRHVARRRRVSAAATGAGGGVGVGPGATPGMGFSSTPWWA